MYYTKDLENILPEKWGNQSGSLKSSIELLGSGTFILFYDFFRVKV